MNAAARLRELLPPRSDWEAVKRAPLGDLVAGSTVALVALPLALAFGVSSGLGAEAGLVTAIVAGAVAAIFGGSNLQVSGPTGAMAVVVVPVAQQYGSRGVLMVGAMAGLVLVALAFAKVGRYARYLPLPVVEGFTAGIAIVIALQQFPAALGASSSPGEKVWQNAFHAVRDFVTHPAAAPLCVALAVAAIILGASRRGPRVPVSLLVVAAATLLTHAASIDLTTLGHLPRTLPGPSLSFVHPGAVERLFPAALAVAALAALESLLSASVADGMTVDERHDPNRELFGQGLANLATSMFGGVPATGAIARTAVNVRAGATSKLASLTHAVVLGAVVFVAAPLVADIPVAALAGVLFATTVRMIQAASLLPVIRATRADAAVLLLTLAVTVVFNLITAIAVGVAVAIVLALRAVARSVRMDETPLDAGDHSEEERALLAEHIVAYRVDGPLFFAAAQRFLFRLTETADVKVVILRMSRVTALDATGAHVLGEAIKHLERRGITVLLSGIQPGHQGVIAALGIAAHLRRDGLLFASTPAAIAHARAIVHEDTTAGKPLAAFATP
ncbi:MAG TPA: SulP family inorganic anion transporter [Gaiellaceae bacterium]|nr:SulP family inorganic anion transporter [Gaiellaceae bacterium]